MVYDEATQTQVALALARYLYKHRNDVTAFGTSRNPSEPVRMFQYVIPGLTADGILGPNTYKAAERLHINLSERPGPA